MMFKEIHRYTDAADRRREAGELDEAAKLYTAGGHLWFGVFHRIPSEDTEIRRFRRGLGYAVESFLKAALCHRILDQPTRSHLRADVALSTVSDLFEYDSYFDHPAYRGLEDELTADFRVVVGDETYEEPYESALSKYQMVESHIGWSDETEFRSAFQPVLDLLDATGYEVHEQELTDARILDLTARIEFKRRVFPELMERVVDAGGW